MAKIGTHPGFVSPARGLLGAAILSIVADRILKGDKDPIRIPDIAASTGESIEAVKDAIVNLALREDIKVEGSTEDSDVLEVAGFHFGLRPIQDTLPIEKPGKIKKRPKAGGFGEDQAVVDGVSYTARVEPAEDGAWLTIVRDSDGHQAVREPAITPQEAWRWFDEWCGSQGGRPNILAWALALPGSGDQAPDGDKTLDVVYLEPRSYEALLDHLLATARIEEARRKFALGCGELVWEGRFYMSAVEAKDAEINGYPHFEESEPEVPEPEAA